MLCFSILSNIRREQIVLTRLRIGHTRITHLWLLKREDWMRYSRTVFDAKILLTNYPSASVNVLTSG